MSPERLSCLLHERQSFLFDLDGTLVDSNSCHERAYLTALQPDHPALAANFNYELCKGRRTRDCLRDLGIGDEDELERLNAAKQQAYREQVESGAITFVAGARELLNALRERGKRLFVVTAGSRRSTETVLSGLGIRNWFDGIVTADDVTECKPSPECWKYCVRESCLEAESSLIVEDALTGIMAARAAGIDAIAVNNPRLSGFPEYAGSIENVLRELLTRARLS